VSEKLEDPDEAATGFSFPLLTTVLYHAQSHVEKMAFDGRKQLSVLRQAHGDAAPPPRLRCASRIVFRNPPRLATSGCTG